MAEVTNYIDRLVAELCPEGVEYRPIEELFTTRNGYTPSKSNSSYWENGTVPWFRMEDIRENGGILSESLQSVHESALKKGGMFPAGSIIVATSATIGEHALINVDFLCNQRFTVLILKDEFKNLLSPKFIYYYSFILDRWCLSNTTQSSFASVDMKRFKKFEFPVPPMEIQEAIVEILDKFTNLEAELEAELEARTLQYEYYRGSLFGTLKDPATGLPAIAGLVKTLCPDGVEYRSLKDVVAKNYGGGTPSKSKAEYWDGNIPWASVGDLSDDVLEVTDTRSKITEEGVKGSSTNIVPAGAVIVAIKINPGRMKIAGMNLAINQDIRGLVLNDSMNARFLTYYFRTLMFAGHGTIVKSITNKHLMETKIPVPPMEIQQRIVDILDRFDALTSSLSEGLPAELAARRSQYEYYRDQLLTFPRKGDNQ